MKVSLILAILLVAGCLTPAQTQDTELDLSGVMNAAQQWATNNLDDRVLRALSAASLSASARPAASVARRADRARARTDPPDRSAASTVRAREGERGRERG